MLFICRKITDRRKTCLKAQVISKIKWKKLTFKKATQTEKRVKNVLRLPPKQP